MLLIKKEVTERPRLYADRLNAIHVPNKSAKLLLVSGIPEEPVAVGVYQKVQNNLENIMLENASQDSCCTYLNFARLMSRLTILNIQATPVPRKFIRTLRLNFWHRFRKWLLDFWRRCRLSFLACDCPCISRGRHISNRRNLLTYVYFDR